jgi:hypothetical protein
MTIQTCTCGAKFVWLKTREGRSMPVNFSDGIKDGDIFDHKVHVSHFSNCPKAGEFRKKKV